MNLCKLATFIAIPAIIFLSVGCANYRGPQVGFSIGYNGIAFGATVGGPAPAVASGYAK